MTFFRRYATVSKTPSTQMPPENTEQDELERKRKAIQKRLKTASRGSAFGG